MTDKEKLAALVERVRAIATKLLADGKADPVYGGPNEATAEELLAVLKEYE